jgi:hypothetical protein
MQARAFGSSLLLKVFIWGHELASRVIGKTIIPIATLSEFILDRFILGSGIRD